MIKHLIDLWVLKEYGLVIFNKTKPYDPDDQCFGGLTSALYGLTKNELHDPLFRFTTQHHQYYLIEKNEILFVGRFPRHKTYKEKKILKELEHVGNKFFECYSKEEIEDWDYDVNRFSDFKDIIKTKNEIIGEFIDKLWEKKAPSGPIVPTSSS